MLNECAVLEFLVEDPPRGDDVRVGRTWYCFENVQAAHILDVDVHRGAPFVRIGCVECVPNRPRIGCPRARYESLSKLLEFSKSEQCSCSLRVTH